MSGNAPINLADLPLQQLQAVKQQMEEEIQHLTTSFAQLKQAQAKFNDCVDSIENIDGKENAPMLIPLTSSLYVPGQLGDVQKVIVDVGTGYMVEKNIPDAKEFYKQKVVFLRENTEKLQETISQREQQYKILIDVMQVKINEAQQQQSTQKK